MIADIALTLLILGVLALCYAVAIGTEWLARRRALARGWCSSDAPDKPTHGQFAARSHRYTIRASIVRQPLSTPAAA